MGTLEDAVKVVRAALEPGADAAAKQQASMVLRSLLAVVEAVPGVPLATGGTPTSTPVVDVLGAIIEKFKALVPATGAKVEIPRLNIPIVTLPPKL